ncbi:MAG: sigma-70 family RNA polymerase sigma factor [Ruminococcaceae bacterium]|nr:sigma-70 family RNA polymerase sigma factor [Oscillospiraceae bacterium]
MFMSEKELLKLAKEGHIDAFEKLIDAHQKRIYNISLKMLANEQDAFDASQDALLKVFKYLKNFKENSSFSTWVYKIAVNTCLDYINKNKKTSQNISLDETITQKDNETTLQFEDKGQNVFDLVLKSERERVLYDALNKLNSEQREMIILRDIEGFSYEEIAVITNNNLGTVKSKISRARIKLKELLLKNKELFLSFFVLITMNIFF